jgi:hypothetical protein
VALSYNVGLYGALPSGFTSSKLYGWGSYQNAYASASAIYSTVSYGAAPMYGSGVLFATSIGLNRSMLSILRDVQAALDPTGVSLAASWGASELQPCPPWLNNPANYNYPNQSVSTPGYGGSWTGVTCSEWDTTTAAATSTLLGGVQALELTRVGLRGSLPNALCELYPSITFFDFSQNNLMGTLPACLGSASTSAVMGRTALSVVDNMVRASARTGRVRLLTLRNCSASVLWHRPTIVPKLEMAGAGVQRDAHWCTAELVHVHQSLCVEWLFWKARAHWDSGAPSLQPRALFLVCCSRCGCTRLMHVRFADTTLCPPPSLRPPTAQHPPGEVARCTPPASAWIGRW